MFEWIIIRFFWCSIGAVIGFLVCALLTAGKWADKAAEKLQEDSKNAE